ncbi:hypothetical protein DMN91_008720 [Ooceraea biroi]|uniref:Uncharacterized protein n=1 Tax=Ooceraea biroi TaxID=2015173 RepID=A0A3L8DDY3_OOCBI|nr:hypothetical protein DMN91_008720 [Ooceraea biroi]
MASIVGRVEAKLRAFKHAAAGVEDPSESPRAIRDSKDFDNTDLLDCELLVVVFVDKVVDNIGGFWDRSIL